MPSHSRTTVDVTVEPVAGRAGWGVVRGHAGAMPAGAVDVLDGEMAAAPVTARYESRIADLERRLAAVEAERAPVESVLREISHEQAKAEVLQHYIANGPAFPSDVAAALQLDALLVFEITEELDSEGMLRDSRPQV